jgi:predicted MPP superfamily phosphohydrolase
MAEKVTRRCFMRSTVRLGIGGSALASGSAWWSRVEPHWIEIMRREFVLPRLPRAFDGFRIAQISDFHVDASGVTDAGRLRHIVQLVNAQKPDAVLLTGDYVTVHGRHWANEFATGFQGLKAPVCAAVLGNHDHWSNAGLVRKALDKCDIRELCNEIWKLERGGAALHLCGMDDPFGKADLAKLTRAVPRGECAVIMQHQPDLADKIGATGVFDLQLSGHSHGGQVRLPGIGAIRLPPGGQKYPMGHYKIENTAMQLYTTRGVGTLWPCVRLNCRPEISLLTLRAA